jgi:hypothetical protein
MLRPDLGHYKNINGPRYDYKRYNEAMSLYASYCEHKIKILEGFLDDREKVKAREAIRQLDREFWERLYKISDSAANREKTLKREYKYIERRHGGI